MTSAWLCHRVAKANKKTPMSTEDAERLVTLLVDAAKELDDAQVDCSITEYYYQERVLSAARSIIGQHFGLQAQESSSMYIRSFKCRDVFSFQKCSAIIAHCDYSNPSQAQAPLR